MLGIGFRGKCFMNTCPLLGLGCGVFLFFVSLLALCLGGLGVLDQGADSTLRDPEIQMLLLVFSFSFWACVFQTNMCLLHFVWEEPLHCRKVEKRFRTLFSLCMQSAWYVEMEFTHTHTHKTHFLPSPLLDCALCRREVGGGAVTPPVLVYAFPSDCITCVPLCHPPCNKMLCYVCALQWWHIGVASLLLGKLDGRLRLFLGAWYPPFGGSSRALCPLPSLAVGRWRWAVRTWGTGQPRVRAAGPPKRPRPDAVIAHASR